MNFGEKLIELRKKEGMSQENLADKLGVARQTISKWELEDTTPDMDNLIKISNIFNVSIDELVGKEHKEKNESKMKKKGFKRIILIIVLLLVFTFAIIFGRRAIIISKIYSNIEKLEFDKFNYSMEFNLQQKIDSENANITLAQEIEYINGVAEGTSSVKKDGKNMAASYQYENSNTEEVYYISGSAENGTILDDGTISNEGEKIKYINYDEYITNEFIKNSFLSMLETEGLGKGIIFNLSYKITKFDDNTVVIEQSTERSKEYIILNIEATEGSITAKLTDVITNEEQVATYSYEKIEDDINDDLTIDMDKSDFKVVDWNEENEEF